MMSKEVIVAWDFNLVSDLLVSRIESEAIHVSTEPSAHLQRSFQRIAWTKRPPAMISRGRWKIVDQIVLEQKRGVTR